MVSWCRVAVPAIVPGLRTLLLRDPPTGVPIIRGYARARGRNNMRSLEKYLGVTLMVPKGLCKQPFDESAAAAGSSFARRVGSRRAGGVQGVGLLRRDEHRPAVTILSAGRATKWVARTSGLRCAPAPDLHVGPSLPSTRMPPFAADPGGLPSPTSVPIGTAESRLTANRPRMPPGILAASGGGPRGDTRLRVAATSRLPARQARARQKRV